MSQLGMGIGMGVGQGPIAFKDITAPTVQSAAVGPSGFTIAVTFNEPVVLVSGDAAKFSLSGSTATIASCNTGISSTLTLTLTASQPINASDTVSLSYDGTGGVKDTSNNALAAFSNQSLTNNSLVNITVVSVTHVAASKNADWVFSEAVTATDIPANLLVDVGGGGYEQPVAFSQVNATTLRLTYTSGNTAANQPWLIQGVPTNLTQAARIVTPQSDVLA